MLSFVSTSAIRVATSKTLQQKMFVPVRTFHSSSLALGQRFTLGTTPRRTRYDFLPIQSQRSRVGGHTHSPGGDRRSNNTTYPTYLYVGGGVMVVGMTGLYFYYQNLAPMTHRRRWIASSPEFEKEMGDEVRKCDGGI
jgi:hypothetical protein